ncbi:MAG: hypothetical protein H6721_00250 [Sandaracinus sp.]|nr:hypothetical protein [Sandaracinus sp.]MCB9614431.1 hypothetical protein [Sandaracinus sp.]MCB9618572.1 hypothetical protein [Sandaracinus sp.]MCB9630573.1 hypothetical protein [Sandaracinus sp.]
MGLPLLDTSRRWVHVAVFPKSASLDEIRAYYVKLRETLERPGPPIWFLVDLSDIDVLETTALQRKTAAEEYDKVAPLFEKRVAGEAFVIANPLVRGVYVAFWWLSNREKGVERETFATEAKARAWVESRAGRSLEGVPTFDEVRRSG